MNQLPKVGIWLIYASLRSQLEADEMNEDWGIQKSCLASSRAYLGKIIIPTVLKSTAKRRKGVAKIVLNLLIACRTLSFLMRFQYKISTRVLYTLNKPA